MVVRSLAALPATARILAFGDQTQLLVNFATFQEGLTWIPDGALRLILPAPSDCGDHFQDNTVTEQRGNVGDARVWQDGKQLVIVRTAEAVASWRRIAISGMPSGATSCAASIRLRARTTRP